MDTESREIDEGYGYIGFREAFELVCSEIRPMGVEQLPLGIVANRIAARDATALVSYPSLDVSTKDGYALKSADVEKAAAESPVFLKLVGSVFAGSQFTAQLRSGEAIRVCTGAPIPSGAEAVVPEEFCQESAIDCVCVKGDSAIGRNILQKGSEVAAGSIVVAEGEVFLPGKMGLAAAAGIGVVGVYRRAKAAIIGIGDEIVLPGEKMRPGQLYASNLVSMKAWLNSFGIECAASVVKDNPQAIGSEIEKRLSEADVLLTSGGAWLSERDLVVGVLAELGWRRIFHHLRMGPGKGAGFGLYKDKPVFCLPGGPASNEMAFLQLALPGILRMSGDKRPPLKSVPAKLAEDLGSRHRDWTEFKDAILSQDSHGAYVVALHQGDSRLQALADANSIICIPEGVDCLRRDAVIPVQLKQPLRSLK
jgi:molybdopterin molybdotransferase